MTPGLWNLILSDAFILKGNLLPPCDPNNICPHFRQKKLKEFNWRVYLRILNKIKIIEIFISVLFTLNSNFSQFIHEDI